MTRSDTLRPLDSVPPTQRRLCRRVVVSGVALLAVLGAVFASPVGRVVDRKLTAHYRVLNQRRVNHRLTLFDGVECRLLYTSIAFGGRLISPEGGAVVTHYLHGEGKDLWLDAEYIRRSPVIRRSLGALREGESRRFSFSQSADYRLSCAVNPFNLRKRKGTVLLWQRIDFATDPTTYTTLDYGAGSFRLPDALIHTLHPQPYTLYAHWDEAPKP